MRSCVWYWKVDWRQTKGWLTLCLCLRQKHVELIKAVSRETNRAACDGIVWMQIFNCSQIFAALMLFCNPHVSMFALVRSLSVCFRERMQIMRSALHNWQTGQYHCRDIQFRFITKSFLFENFGINKSYFKISPSRMKAWKKSSRST